MIIFGTTSTRKKLDFGTFSCPQCQAESNFEKRRARSWFHLYFIPLIPMKTYPPYVECKSCNATFVEGVLNNASANSDGIRAEFETGALAILARMAWADGVIEPEEVDAIYTVVNSMCVREFARADIEAEIASAKDSLDDALSVASRIGHVLNDDGKEMILQAVFHIAASDGDFAREEHEMMLEIGAGLGLRPAHTKGIIQEIMENAAHAAEARPTQ